MEPPSGDEERQGANMQGNTSAAWLDRIGQFSNTIIGAASAILVQLLIGYKSIEEFNNNLTKFWICILLLVFASAAGLMFCKVHFSDEKELSSSQKMIFISLSLLTNTAAITASAFVLDILYKSYVGLAAIPILEFILATALFYFELKLGQPQETPNNSEEREFMAKNCFKLATATTVAAFLVQTTLIFGYLTNPNFPKKHPQYNLTVPFLTSSLGSSAMKITSSPLQFKSDLMYGILKQIPKVMAFSLWLLAAILSSEFLDSTMIVVAVTITFSVEFMVNLCKKSWDQQTTGHSSTSSGYVEVDSMFAIIAEFGFQVLCTIYAVKFGSQGYDSYLIYSVFFLLMAVTTSLIRMVLPFCPTCHNGKIKIIQRLNYSLPAVYALVSVALFLTEIYTYVNKRSSAVKFIPLRGPPPPVPH